MGELVAIARTVLGDRELFDDIEARFAECIATATSAWPAFHVARERYVRALAERLATDVPAERALAALHAADLYLACGCVDGDPAALAAFELHCGPVIERAVATTGASGAERADLGQVVRQRLLVTRADGEPPRISTYSARGSLGSWVRVVAIREAARMLPRARREVGAADDELAGLIAADDDPEVGYLKRLYRDEFRRAFAAAIDALEDRDRLVLRQHALDGLSIDQLAAFHGVHRATTARWIEAAREAVLTATQAELIRRLQLSRTELASVMRLIRSQLDLSLPRLLRR